MSTGVWVLLGALALAGVVALHRARTDGRFAAGGRSSATEAEERTVTTWDAVRPAAGVEPGDRATLVQFSSAFCAPCRATRRVLGEVAEVVPGVVHVEIDAEHHLDLVRELGVVRTPTTIVLDAAGAERTRAVGAPRKEQVLAALVG